ncbi:MAG: DUF354 domain-containing protein [Bacteroidaceae bacterium]|nr:DUF354 domain-containing protein [Bacteroidaceae bacterium]
MKILININHPAHVHYFRNFIQLMEAKGHQFCVINRDSKMINQLLDNYGIPHTIRNKRPEKAGTVASLKNLLTMILWCIRKSFSFRPDMYMGFASSACAITSWLFRKPCILIDDTEHNTMTHKLYMPVCSKVLTPFYFETDLGNQGKQVRFNAYVEQLYLHSAYYKKQTGVLEELNVKPKEYVLIRYVAYDAHHDVNVRPIPEETKKAIVKKIAKRYRVFVSLEKSDKDPFYDDYVLEISPEKMHDVEANAKFMVAEGATMASECFLLGVPYLYLNPLKVGNINYQCKNYPDRCFRTTDSDVAMKVLDQLMNSEVDGEAERRKVEEQTINPTEYLIKFVEDFR